MAVPVCFRATGPVLVRATTDPGDLDLPCHLDVCDPTAVERDGATWMARIWSRPEVREAVGLASPVLAAELDRLCRETVSTRGKDLRRAITSLAAYLLRWQRRATPFGLFAGLSTATIGPAGASIGAEHRAMAGIDAEWLATVVDRLERHRQLRPRLLVVADNTGVVRDGRLFVARRTEIGAGHPTPLREASVRCTRPVQAAMALAATPIRLDVLAAALTDRFATATSEQVWAVLDDLVDQRFLITNLRAPMTAPNHLAHLIDALTAANTGDIDDVAALLDQLRDTQRHLLSHNAASHRATQATRRARLSRQMASLVPDCRHTLAVDTRLDARVTIPDAVLTEAEQAASVLLRLSTKPFGSAAWLDYHSRFRARYGHGALVAVTDLLSDSGLGYPTGYLGAPRAHPAWRTLTERDAAVLALMQRAAMDGSQEIVLTDADIDALTVGEPNEVVVPERIELGVAVCATSRQALDAGRFRLQVTATPAVPTSMAGRFAHLLDDHDRAGLAASYAGETDGGVVAVQMSFPPRRPHNDNVTHVPPLLPTVLALAEHPTGTPIRLDDVAVTADGDQMYLVQVSTGRRMVPRIPHALDTTVQTPPLARFLAEVANARAAVFGPLDLGAARTLPYVPRIRYRRTVLAAACWRVSADEVSVHTGRRWEADLQAWRRRWRLPARVVVCHGELRLPLNLDHRLDRSLLHHHLARARRIELREDIGADEHDWIGRPAELLIGMAATTPSRRAVPTTTPPAALLVPGDSTLVHARLAGNPARFDQIITGHLPRLGAALHGLVQRWWLRRHRDLIRLDADQCLILVLRLTDRAHHGHVAAQLAAFAADLHAQGLPAALSFVPYQDHPGRYGEGPALAAAEQVFAADTNCAIAQVTAAEATGIPAQALAAASMVRLAAGLAADSASGYRALIDGLPRQTGHLDRVLRDHTLRLAEPGATTLAGSTDTETVVAAWTARDVALAAYTRALAGQRDPAGILRSLLHEHHVRALGVDPGFEKVTGRLARAAAMRCLALADTR